jgi:methylglyoxal synthase
MKRLTSLFAVLVAGDVLTTAYGLSIGGVEGNPLGPVLAIGAKVAAVALALLLLRFQVPRWRALTASPVVIALGLPVAWNALQLAGVA